METDTAIETFGDGYALFDSQYLGHFRALREHEDDYGIIQWTTLEENMTDSRIYVRNPVAQVIAADVGDEKNRQLRHHH